MRGATLFLSCTLLFGSGCAGSLSAQSGEADFMPARSELVQHLYIYQAAESVEARGAALAEAWRHAGALRDDAILRRLLQELPDVPGALTAAHLFEVAVREASAPEGSAAALSTLDKIDTSTDEATRWTAARGELLRASLLPPSQEQQALVALRRVGRLNPVGALGRAQMAQAWLLEGSIEHRSGRYKEAIAAYLKVPQSSGLWRDARLGMAWSQLRIAQSDRALASLALLPGGLTGEPERALVAAMAAGTLGKVDAARAVVDEARLRAKAWLKDDVEPAALLSAALPIGRSVRLRETAEGLFVRLSAHPAVRLYAAELRDARSLQETTPGDPAIAAYVAQLESGWPALVERLVSRERARVGHGLAGLDALEPQLRAGD